MSIWSKSYVLQNLLMGSIRTIQYSVWDADPLFNVGGILSRIWIGVRVVRVWPNIDSLLSKGDYSSEKVISISMTNGDWVQVQIY